MKYQLFFLFISLFFSCTNVRTEKANCADTIFVLGQTSLVAHLDTIEILWRPTSSVKCPQFKEKMTRQRCYALDLDRLNKTNIKKIKGIKIKTNYFYCVSAFDKESIMKVKYIKEYNTNLNSNILEEVKGKYKVMRLDYRDRKLFYETMFCLENYYGQANLYSTSERGNPIKRELANFVVWNLKNQTIILKDTPVDNCIYPPSGKRKIQIVLERK